MSCRHLLLLLFGCAGSSTSVSPTTPDVEPAPAEQARWEPAPGTAHIFGLAYAEPDLASGTVGAVLKSEDSELSIDFDRRDAEYTADSVATEVALRFRAITQHEPEPTTDVMLAGNEGRLVRITGEDRNRAMHVAFATSAIGTEQTLRLTGITRERDESFVEMCAGLSTETPTLAPAPGRQRVHLGGHWLDADSDLDHVMVTYRLDQERATIRIRITPSEEVHDPAGSATESTEYRTVTDVEHSEVTVAGHAGTSTSFTVEADGETWGEQMTVVPLDERRTLVLSGEAIAPEAWRTFVASFR